MTYLHNTEGEITTNSNTFINLLDPKAEDLHIEDIAHSLSMQCRFNGHTKVWYSVAEHSLKVCELVETKFPELALTALMHDASEAYLTDLAKPIKVMMSKYQELEENLESIISAKWGLQFPLPTEVKLADIQAFEMEWNELVIKGTIPVVYKKTMSPAEAKEKFLRKYYELYDK